MATKKSTAITPVTERYGALAIAGDVAEAAQVNFADDPLGGGSWTDLERIKVLGGGAQGLEIIDPVSEESVHEKSVAGLPVYLKHARALYLGDDGELGGAPDCSSNDGRVGQGIRREGAQPSAAKCATCPLAQYGSGKNGGQACSSLALLFVLREGSVLPSVLKIPTMSLKPLRRFMMQLTAQGIPYFAAEMSFSTSQAKNAKGVAYSRVQLEVVRKLDGDEKASARAYFEGMHEQFGSKGLGDLVADINSSGTREESVQVEDVSGADYPGADDEEIEAAAAAHDEVIPF